MEDAEGVVDGRLGKKLCRSFKDTACEICYRDLDGRCLCRLGVADGCVRGEFGEVARDCDPAVFARQRFC